VKYFWLNFHAGYACRDSGMCCSSGWPIPVEGVRVPAIEAEILAKTIPLRVEPWLVAGDEAPDDVAGILALRSNGHCVFFEAGRPGCAIHDVKPAGCVHFPYVCLIDQRGVHVTLSHYCPTAVAMLFEHDGPIAIVEGPPPVGDGSDIEGLDARESLPPMLAGAQRLMSFDELTAWERDRVAAASIDELHAGDAGLFERARRAVPAPWVWPDVPERLDELWWSQVAPSWSRFNDVLTRYTAAKAFASWSLYLGDGLDAAAGTARIAAAVLRIECARQCAFFRRPLDRELMTEAIRQTDLLLVHYADPALLASASTDRQPG
jgi:Fe-S-cluster containining protein